MVNMLSTPLISRLAQNQRFDGGFAYSPTGSSAAEPTALAALAFSNPLVGEQGRATRAADWLKAAQQGDGSVPVSASLQSPAWTTSLAILAWHRGPDRSRFHQSTQRATDWLLKNQGLSSSVRLNEAQHDATIVGWSWVDGTHSWVEPTAYAVLALRSIGQSGHARTTDGVRLLRDRALPTGGWNYGNSTVLANTLRPFPETTGVALAGLAGLERNDAIEASLSFLETELPRIRSPLALGWGLIGLTMWNRRPLAAKQWLEEATANNDGRPPNAQHDALLLLASEETPALAVESGQAKGPR